MPDLGLSRKVWLTLAIGAFGVVLGRALRIPGGAFTGAMLATAIASLLNAPQAASPAWLRSAARIVLGLTIGASVTTDTLHAVAQALLPVSIMVVFMMALGLFTGWLINRLARMPLPTALCGAAPGALAAMVSLSEELGGDSPVVASMQLVRLISVILFMPPFIFATFVGGTPAATPLLASAVQAPPLGLAAMLAVALLLGTLAGRYKVPAGELLAGMAVAAILNPLWLNVPELPTTWQLFARWIVGAGVGATVTRETLRTFKPFAMVGGIMTVSFIAAGLGLGWFLAQVSSLDLITCVVGCAPGGAETMIIIAGELGADVQLVTAMHVSRLVLLMALLPMFIRLINKRHQAPELAAVAGPAPAMSSGEGT
jgi:hypothetical protein